MLIHERTPHSCVGRSPVRAWGRRTVGITQTIVRIRGCTSRGAEADPDDCPARRAGAPDALGVLCSLSTSGGHRRTGPRPAPSPLGDALVGTGIPRGGRVCRRGGPGPPRGDRDAQRAPGPHSRPPRKRLHTPSSSFPLGPDGALVPTSRRSRDHRAGRHGRGQKPDSGARGNRPLRQSNPSRRLVDVRIFAHALFTF